jgi:putative hydrolase of the HAD superfamily
VSTERNDGLSNVTAVILDYGKVIARSPTEQEFGRMAEIFNVCFDSFFQLWENSRDVYDRSDLTAEEYWLMLATQTNTSIDSKQIEFLRRVEVEIWSHLDPEMLDWLSRLQAAGIKTALLSNMPWDLVKHVRTNFKWMENFTFKTFSAEVKLVKPHPAIYQHTLQGLGVSAAEALFVDDRERNTTAAQALGIRAIQYHTIEQLRDDLQKLNFPVLPVLSNATSSSSATDSSIERPAQEHKFQL